MLSLLCKLGMEPQQPKSGDYHITHNLPSCIYIYIIFFMPGRYAESCVHRVVRQWWGNYCYSIIQYLLEAWWGNNGRACFISHLKQTMEGTSTFGRHLHAHCAYNIGKKEEAYYLFLQTANGLLFMKIPLFSFFVLTFPNLFHEWITFRGFRGWLADGGRGHVWSRRGGKGSRQAVTVRRCVWSLQKFSIASHFLVWKSSNLNCQKCQQYAGVEHNRIDVLV